MADVKAEHVSTVKRKTDTPESIGETLDKEEHEADSIKKRKLETPSCNDAFSCAADEKNPDLKQHHNTSHHEDEEEDDDDDQEDYEGEEDKQSDGEEAILNGKGKGKGIVRDDKGKGKLIEESDHDDDDSSDDCESELSGFDSDLADDPLAEVDLDNILPSRTQRSAIQPGFHISDDRNQGSDA
ncbi:unnamed protein product [Fraxinus pennsylvanica]|uniref:Uncharacterized protein n=1 Tax=Fraxinus pennsylvanica TaxID=56036 RepID=A0AAD1ZX49_9LAMI|nr:unnamed protein product [Fraxinus pennsylvanica]